MSAVAASAQPYVTAFPGRRDSYQVPLALHEQGRLAAFVTSAYDTGWIARTLQRAGLRGIARRRCPELPDARVQANFDLELGAHLLARWVEPSRGAVIADDWLARRAAAVANAQQASVLFYEFQADLGFQLVRGPRQRRVLFHFHPHPGWEHPLLRREAAAYPQFAPEIFSHLRTGQPARFAGHTQRAWTHADHVIVASSCTRDSLLYAGCPAERISIVPYGRETVEAAVTPLVTVPRYERPFLLWVGGGSVRKGLHHLCQAWERAEAHRVADLIVVARVLDAGMEAMLARPGIRWLPGLPRAELNWHYQHAQAFVLPSLSEGFGQVYLEALAHGCPVIGTRHSVLADATRSRPFIRFVTPGDVTSLAEAIRETVAHPAPDAATRAAAAASVQDYTWENFRTGVEAVLRRLD